MTAKRGGFGDRGASAEGFSVLPLSVGTFVFGPYDEGDEIAALRFYFDSVAVAAGQQLTVAVGMASTFVTAAAFAANVRVVVGLTDSVNIGVGNRSALLPLGAVFQDKERFLAVQIAHLGAEAVAGSIWTVERWQMEWPLFGI